MSTTSGPRGTPLSNEARAAKPGKQVSRPLWSMAPMHPSNEARAAKPGKRFELELNFVPGARFQRSPGREARETLYA